MARARHIVAGLHVPHCVRVELPQRHSFDPWVVEQLKGWHEIKQNYSVNRQGRLCFTLSPVNIEKLWSSVYPDDLDQIGHNLRALIYGEHARHDVCVLDFDEELHDPMWDRGWVVSSLRLFAPGDVRPGPTLFPATAAEKGSAFGQLDWTNVPTWHDLWLTAAETDQIPAFFAALHQVMPEFARPRLAIPRRYYAKALHRRLDAAYGEHPEREFQPHYVPTEDAVYLLTASLEALFTLGSGHDGNVKLNERFVERIVRFWGDGSPTSVPLRELLVWAYDVRSEVAHGAFDGFAKRKKYGEVFGPEVQDLPDTTAAHLRNLVRSSILAVAGVLGARIAPRTLARALDDGPEDFKHMATYQAIRRHRDDIPRLGGSRDIAITHRLSVDWH